MPGSREKEERKGVRRISGRLRQHVSPGGQIRIPGWKPTGVGSPGSTGPSGMRLEDVPCPASCRRHHPRCRGILGTRSDRRFRCNRTMRRSGIASRRARRAWPLFRGRRRLSGIGGPSCPFLLHHGTVPPVGGRECPGFSPSANRSAEGIRTDGSKEETAGGGSCPGCRGDGARRRVPRSGASGPSCTGGRGRRRAGDT